MEENKAKFTDPIFLPFLVAAQFLTVLPPVIRREFSSEELGKAVAFFPAVGLVIGGILVGTKTLFMLAMPKAITTGLVLGIWIILSGVIHLDGFLDACDGLFGGSTPEKRLEVMRDERIGAFAFAGGFLLLLLKYSALETTMSWRLLIAAPVIGRWAMTWVLVYFPYARKTGLGRSMKDHASSTQALIGGLITTVIMVWLSGLNGVFVILGITLVISVIGYLVMKRIPGMTGDIYGAVCEIGELLMLLIGAVFGSQLWLN